MGYSISHFVFRQILLECSAERSSNFQVGMISVTSCLKSITQCFVLTLFVCLFIHLQLPQAGFMCETFDAIAKADDES